MTFTLAPASLLRNPRFTVTIYFGDGAQQEMHQTEIVHLLAEGKSNKEIAAQLGITVRTVETHRAKIMLKLGLHSLADLIHYAMRHGMVSAQADKRR